MEKGFVVNETSQFTLVSFVRLFGHILAYESWHQTNRRTAKNALSSPEHLYSKYGAQLSRCVYYALFNATRTLIGGFHSLESLCS